MSLNGCNYVKKREEVYCYLGYNLKAVISVGVDWESDA